MMEAVIESLAVMVTVQNPAYRPAAKNTRALIYSALVMMFQVDEKVKVLLISTFHSF